MINLTTLLALLVSTKFVDTCLKDLTRNSYVFRVDACCLTHYHLSAIDLFR